MFVTHYLTAVQDMHNIKLAEAAQRWLQHHSAIGPEDAVLLGVSSIDHVDANIKDWYVFMSLPFVVLTIHIVRAAHFRTIPSNYWMMPGPKPRVWYRTTERSEG